ncbi:MAG: Nif3-like dinuclear metal center hexameric protein [Bacteroidales bacterium]|jgi:dinuclear metal center YbgI/SA1388 family protein|nr:Nif3-like dinuclear metal center hexameric protein [Bacteroidales bacterium]
MTARDIISILEEFAPAGIQEEWDNSGLMVGDISREIDSVLLALDCTPEVIEEAGERGVKMIVTHHPLIFKGVKSIGADNILGRAIMSAIKKDIIIYSMHTNIDKVPGGVSSLMAGRLGLINVQILESEDNGATGLGVIGDLEEEMSVRDFIKVVKESFSLNIIRSSKERVKKIKRVALCGGSGGSLINRARLSGADVFISGDISYHNYFCEDGFMVMDIGHYESEIDVLNLLMSVILKKIPNFAVHISEKNNNPIYYH